MVNISNVGRICRKYRRRGPARRGRGGGGGAAPALLGIAALLAVASCAQGEFPTLCSAREVPPVTAADERRALEDELARTHREMAPAAPARDAVQDSVR